MPHRSSQKKNEAVTSSSKEPMQASASRTFLLQHFQRKEEDTTQILLPYNLLTTGSSPHKNMKVPSRHFNV